jgi:putative transposase
MSNYRRWFVPGGTYFFTLVTYQRQPTLTSDLSRSILHEAFALVKKQRPFEQLAIVLLPDHLHLLWSLPPGDDAYAIRLKRIKEEFTTNFLRAGGQESKTTDAEKFRGQRGVWQPRFWEHTIEDAEDLEAHFDYIHWNPLKHGLVQSVDEWPWSTFHKYRAAGHYEPGWGSCEPTTYESIKSFGEPSD